MNTFSNAINIPSPSTSPSQITFSYSPFKSLNQLKHPPTPPLINTIPKSSFSQSYSILSIIGQGASSTVYSIIRTCDNTLLSLKRINKCNIPINHWKKDSKLGTIPLEIYILSKLRHSNIISFIDIQEDSLYYYLVTQFHPYNTPNTQNQTMDLFEFIKSKPPLHEWQIIHILTQLISAVHYLHSNYINHLDIKDENILIDSRMNIKLIDFGSARLMPRKSEIVKVLKEFKGSVLYAPPEVLKNKGFIGSKVDMWQIGVLLYVMLYRRMPFETVDDIIKGNIAYVYDISNDMKILLNGLLNVDIEERMTSKELMDKLVNDSK